MALPRDRVLAVSWTALAEVAYLTDKDADQIVGLRREGAEWVVDVDVVDVHRVPDTTDFIATYRVRLDDAGEVLDLRRVGHHVRGWIDDGR